jgi:hypothetical protein
MNVDQNIFQIHNNIDRVSINDYTTKTNSTLRFIGTSINKTDDDNISILAPHQSYFDEYPSGTGKYRN